jgi:hypothetical protein
VTLLFALAALAIEPSADVVVSRRFDAAPEAIYAHLIDARNVKAAAPDACMRSWMFPGRTEGIGAQFRVVYALEGWRRRLDVSVVAADPPRRIEWDHHGNRGFTTRFTIAPDEPGARVTVHTYLNEPPWPFRKYYVRKVQPAWRACYTELLENVAAVIGESPRDR